MILTDIDILRRMKQSEIKITPLPTHHQIQPSSVDLRLGSEFWEMITQTEPIDPKNTEPKYNIIRTNALIIPPNNFVLGTTKEHIELPPDLAGRVEGRSSLGRLGIAVHITAGFIDAGFKGQITLEIKNQSPNPVILYENMRICQITFEQLTGEPKRTYGECDNKYQNQEGVTGSLIQWDSDTDNYGETK